MSRTMLRSAVLLGLAGALSACGGGGGGATVTDSNGNILQLDPDTGLCSGLIGGTVSDVQQPGSTLDQSSQIFDGKAATVAKLTVTGSGGTLVAGTGPQQPAGGYAGIYFDSPTSGALTMSVQTLLGGVPQASFSSATRDFDTGSDNCSQLATDVICQWNGSGPSFVGIKATSPYDTIQVTIDYTGLEPLALHELCVQ